MVASARIEPKERAQYAGISNVVRKGALYSVDRLSNLLSLNLKKILLCRSAESIFLNFR